jgi:hypothetical protein
MRPPKPIRTPGLFREFDALACRDKADDDPGRGSGRGADIPRHKRRKGDDIVFDPKAHKYEAQQAV